MKKLIFLFGFDDRTDDSAFRIMYIVCDIAKVSVKQLAVASVPFYIVLLLALLTMIFIPQTVTYLPNLLFK
jgi:TRAP-type C4-dicarboxylate transport system permease large subunit